MTSPPAKGDVMIAPELNDPRAGRRLRRVYRMHVRRPYFGDA